MSASDVQDMIHRADAARGEFARTGLLVHADEAVRLWGAVVEQCPVADCFDELGSALVDRFEAGGQADDLRRARTAYQEAVRLDRDPALLNNLGNCLRLCYRNLGERDALAEAFSVLSEAVDNISPQDEDRLLCQDNLALVLADRFELAGNRDDLERAFLLHSQVVEAVAPENPELTRFCSNLGACAQELFAQTKDTGYLRQAEQTFVVSVELTHPDAPEYAMRLANLASARLDLLECGERAVDLDAVVADAERAIALGPQTETDGPRRLCVLADALRARYLNTGKAADAERAIDVYRRAMRSAPNKSTSATCANNLALAFLARFDRYGTPDDVEAAVEAALAAVDATQHVAPLQALCTGTLASALITRYELRGALSDLDWAIEVSERAVLQTPFEGWSRARRLRNAGAALAYRFDALGDASDLRRCVRHFESAAHAEALNGQAGPDGVAALHDLGVALRDLFRYSGDQRDLDRAVDCLRNALQRADERTAMHARCLVSLARALAARHRHAGDPADLAEGIALAERLAAEAGDDEPIRVEFRGDHADLLQQRFEREGVGIDLDQAVALYQRAVREIPETAPARVGLLNDWGICLWTRYGHTKRIDDLVTAESAFRAALDLAAPSAPDRPIYLDNLGTCLVDRYRAEADGALLAAATAAYLEALAGLPDTSPAHPRIEANYASALWEQWANTGDALVLDAVIDSLRQVLARVPPSSVGRVRWSSNLAVALERRFGTSGLDSDRDQAVELHLTACTMGMTADLGWCLHSALNWGRAAMARGAWLEAARAHRYGQDASRRLFTLQHARRHKEDWLRQAVGLTVDAAVASLHLGDAAEAVRALEEGRAQMLSETLARDALDLAGLTAAGRADLANRYRSAVSKLTWLDGRVDAAGGRPSRAGSQLSSNS